MHGRHAMRSLGLAALLAGTAALVGCGKPGKVDEEPIEVQQNSPLAQAKQLLDRYAKGQKPGSETTSYEYLVNEVRKTDSARADVLEKGFADLQKPKVNTKAKAAEILKQLAPKMTGG